MYLLDCCCYIYVSCSFFLDFDEQTADDWDVDMSVYYDKGISSVMITTIDKENQTVNFCLQSFLTQLFLSQMEETWMPVTTSECGMRKG